MSKPPAPAGPTFTEREELLLEAVEGARELHAQAEIRLEAARRNALASESALRADSGKTRAEVRTLTAVLADRDAFWLPSVEDLRSRLSDALAGLERERQSHREAAAAAEARLTARSAEFAEREALLMREVAEGRSLREALGRELEKVRRREREAGRAFRETQKKSLSKARVAAAEAAARQLESAQNTRSLILALERELLKSRRAEKDLLVRFVAAKRALAKLRDKG